MGSFQKFRLRWNNHSSNFVGNLGSLLESEEYSDVTVCCQGQVWHLHQLVLSASSGHFAHLLRLIPVGQTPILILDGPPARDVQALIHFIYHGEVNIDQDALPSLLRTASSFRIKGLSDVNPATEAIGSNSAIAVDTFPSSVSVESLTHTHADEAIFEDDISPLNLSCHKNPAKESFVIEKRSFKQSSSDDVHSHNDKPADVNYNPSPCKKIRILEPNFRRQEPATIALIAPNNGAIITPYVSTKQSNPFSKDAESKSFPIPAENGLQFSLENVIPHEMRIDSSPKEFTPFTNISSKPSFPILKMALSPQLAYQPSSTTSPNPEPKSPYREHQQVETNAKLAISISDEESQTHDGAYRRISRTNDSPNLCDQSPDSRGGLLAAEIYISKSKCNSSLDDSALECKIESTDEDMPSSNCDGDQPQIEVPETTFTHKKFSACTIPQSSSPKKCLHAVRGVINSTNNSAIYSSSTGDYKNTDSNVPHTEAPYNAVGSSNRTSSPDNLSSSVVSAPNIVKLAPVSLAGFTPNSTVYSAFDSSATDTSAISSSSPPSEAISVPVVIQTVTVKAEDQTSPYLQSLFRQVGTSEAIETVTSAIQSPPGSTSSITTTGEGVNVTPTAQRVTINMRTFKEEWRRQLLVDYDTNTNMSICMLCFTTFKSYDGPRKNTYVKHAKRFHPALEEYSDEERGVIISMYEKYHKYDLDMQKEINKSFRTTNGSGAALKRMRAAESMQILHHPSGISSLPSNHSDTDPESSDFKRESNSDLNLRDTADSSSMEPEALVKNTAGSGPATPSSDKSSSDKDFSTNNNNKNNRNKNEPPQLEERLES